MLNKISAPTRALVGIMLAASVLTSGCASIVHGGNRTLTINSDPSGAKVTISKAEGQLVQVDKTPCTVSLDPKKSYFKGQTYVLKLELAGYKPSQVELRPSMSGWYWGNIVFGGLIGMLAVDPVTGSMWNIEPNKIEQKLSPDQAALIESGNGFVVVLASDLTPGERQAMTKLAN